jgi:hypothetical protein
MVKRIIIVLLSIVVVAFVIGSAFGSIFFHSSYDELLPSSSVVLHELVFTQEGACSPTVYGAPWFVVLNNMTTLIEPAASTLPSQNGFAASPLFKNYSVIVFAVAQGTYEYSVGGPAFFLSHPSGRIIVNGSDATVVLAGPDLSCTTSLNTTTTSNTSLTTS